MFKLNQRVLVNDPYSSVQYEEATVIKMYTENDRELVLTQTSNGEETFMPHHLIKKFKCTLCDIEYYPGDYSEDEEYISHCPVCNSIQCIVIED